MQCFEIAFATRFLRAAAVTVLLALAACSVGNYTRGQFEGIAIGHTEDEITGRLGKPDQVDAANPKRVKWVYLARTFDPDNLNAKDTKATIYLEPNAEGKLSGKDVVYN